MDKDDEARVTHPTNGVCPFTRTTRCGSRTREQVDRRNSTACYMHIFKTPMAAWPTLSRRAQVRGTVRDALRPPSAVARRTARAR